MQKSSGSLGTSKHRKSGVSPQNKSNIMAACRLVNSWAKKAHPKKMYDSVKELFNRKKGR